MPSSTSQQPQPTLLGQMNCHSLVEAGACRWTPSDGNSRNVAAMSWRKTIQAFKRHGEKNGCHVIEVPPEGTTKRCSQCGCSTEKPLWVREHSCPACGFEADRDYNSALEMTCLQSASSKQEAPASRSRRRRRVGRVVQPDIVSLGPRPNTLRGGGPMSSYNLT
jgi:hypothetical protein